MAFIAGIWADFGQRESHQQYKKKVWNLMIRSIKKYMNFF